MGTGRRGMRKRVQSESAAQMNGKLARAPWKAGIQRHDGIVWHGERNHLARAHDLGGSEADSAVRQRSCQLSRAVRPARRNSRDVRAFRGKRARKR
jgi:hypothetical protein